MIAGNKRERSGPAVNGKGTSDLSTFRKLKRYSFGEQTGDNLVIQGENLATLEDLTPNYLGSVRCIYIDPPYNNGETYAHFDDVHAHDDWIEGLVKRLEALRSFLAPDGSLWISIDDGEVHYLKVAADAVFGRENFVSTIIWQQRTSRENRKVFSNNHEYVLVYAKSVREFSEGRNLLPLTDEVLARYKNPDEDPRGPWQSVSANVQDGHATAGQFYELRAPSGKLHRPPKGRCWVYTQDRMMAEIERNNVWFGKDGDGVPRLKKFLRDARQGLTPHTLWPASEVGTTRDAKRELLQLFPGLSLFDTPKPEALIARILGIATDPGDLVMDAYLGSGTTTAVAHKMGRKYIGIEEGKHAVTHCARRLRQVVRGEDGGMSGVLGWEGGGGFSFLKHRGRR